MIILQISDFVGFFELALSPKAETILQAYIDDHEADYIRKLLGPNLGNAFIADKSQPTQDPVFAVIEDPFQIEDDELNHTSKGMKHLLQSLIFYEFVKDTQYHHTQSGVVRREVETALNMTGRAASRHGENKRNKSKDTWDEIQWYVNEYAPEDYTDTPFNGEEMDLEWGSIMG